MSSLWISSKSFDDKNPAITYLALPTANHSA